MAFNELQADLTAKLAESAPSIRVNVIESLAKKEQQARADAVLAVLEKIQAATKGFYKLKEDQATYNADGTVQSTGFSKTKLDERKKAQEDIDRLEKALSQALSPENGKYDFSKVKEIAGKTE